VGIPSNTVARQRVALVHDFLLDVRGAERVFLELCELYPQAEIYTAVYDEVGTEGRFADRVVHSSFLQALRPSARTFRALLPFYPAAIESFDFSGYDLVVSSSSAWAHGVLCDESTVHVSYCHNPFRYAWNDRERTIASRRDPVTRAFQRTDRYIATSRTSQARIRAYFGRDAPIVHPPVNTARFSPGRVGEHYVVLSELMPHKQIDVAIAAFNSLRLPLIVVGDGPEARRLRREAGSTIKFAGRVSDREVAQITQGARALIVTSVEEFGIAAVECQAAGRPVIARRGGGALETVIDGVTGQLWSGGPEELAAAVLEFDDLAVDSEACVRSAKRFDVPSFRHDFLAEVSAACKHGSRTRLGERQPLVAARLARRAARDPHR
jgi:glycosyltransferase involved in cell wall biosynthesis